MRDKIERLLQGSRFDRFYRPATAFYQKNADFDEEARDLIGGGSERSGHWMPFGLCRAVPALCLHALPARAYYGRQTFAAGNRLLSQTAA
jgi:hypothetical protein